MRQRPASLCPRPMCWGYVGQMRTQLRRLSPILAALTLASCTSKDGASGNSSATPSAADSSFSALTRQILGDYYERNPSSAVDLGIHKWDAKISMNTQADIAAEVQALKGFRAKLAAVDTAGL